MHISRHFKISALAVGALLGACDEQDDDDQTPDASSSFDSGLGGTRDAGDASVAASADAQVGYFNLQLVAADEPTSTPAYTALLGKVYDGPTPEDTIWNPTQREGDCVLLTPEYPFCETACLDGVCVAENVCQRTPKTLNVGTLTIKGLTSTTGPGDITVTLPTSSTSNAYQLPGSVQLAYPPFTEGSAVSLSASGGSGVGTFTLQGKGIAPLSLSGQGAYPIASGQPLNLTWTAAQSASVSSIHVKLDISHHGGSKGKIECDTADDGSLEISAAMMTRLISLGVAGFPSVAVTRSSTSSTGTSVGKVELKIYSFLEREVSVPGVVSCTEAADCAAGQSCRDDKTCR